MSRGVNKFKDMEEKLYKYYRDQKILEQKIRQKLFYEESKNKFENMVKCYTNDEKEREELNIHIDIIDKQIINIQKEILVKDLYVRNIQIIISKLDEDERNFIRWKYSEKMSLYTIREKFHYSAPTYYRIRNKILERLQQSL